MESPNEPLSGSGRNILSYFVRIFSTRAGTDQSLGSTPLTVRHVNVVSGLQKKKNQFFPGLYAASDRSFLHSATEPLLYWREAQKIHYPSNLVKRESALVHIISEFRVHLPWNKLGTLFLRPFWYFLRNGSVTRSGRKVAGARSCKVTQKRSYNCSDANPITICRLCSRLAQR